jgi:hypothetical protein
MQMADLFSLHRDKLCGNLTDVKLCLNFDVFKLRTVGLHDL